VAALLALMAILVVGALIFLVVLGSSVPPPEDGRKGTSPGERTEPPPPPEEPAYLNDVTLDQVGSFALEDWEYDTADAKANGAIDGVAMLYRHSDGAELTVTYWEWRTESASSSGLNEVVSNVQSDGYQKVTEFPVEVDGEEVGQAVQFHRSGQLEVVVWTNGVLLALAEAPTEDYLQEYYDNRPY
jgi:hypothetical protein